ncbi:MAG: beta-lactamase family protein [Anaerolineae bacterium]|nr:beta-lactamase family protein [Anaerolineae bacterium]
MEFEQLKTVVQVSMEKHHVPGIAVGLLHNGEVETGAFGVTSVDHPLEVTDETLFQIGSITKTFTTTAMMRLVEMGKLELDAPVRTYLPDFKVADKEASSATLRHLLTHTAGWVGDFFLDTGAGDDAVSKYIAQIAELEQIAPIGMAYSYNNTGFYVAGAIVEAVTGKPYQAALKELVLDPLGLDRVYFDPGDVMVHRFAVGHNIHEGTAGVATPWPLPRAAYPAGGIACGVKTLLRYASFHLGNGTWEETQLLTPETMALMQSPQVKIWDDHSVGLSWHLDEVEGLHTFGHGGGTNGQVSMLTLVTEHKTALVIFTNAEEGGSVTDEVQRWFLKESFGVERKKPEPIATTGDELRSFVGKYTRPFADIELAVLCGRLIGQIVFKQGFPDKDAPPPPAPAPVVLTRCEENRLLIMDGPFKNDCADVIRKPDGSIGWLRMGRLYKRVE